MKLFLVLLATFAYAAAVGHDESIGYDQPNFDRYSQGYGNPEEYHDHQALITVPVPYVIGRQGIGFDFRTAFADGFRNPLTLKMLEVLRRYPEHHHKG